jgi:hypothetical protein
MPTDVPFDVWNGEDLATAEVILSDSAEEVAMHLEEDEDPPAVTWSDLTGQDRQVHPEAADDEPPVSYFADEQPEGRDEDELAEHPIEGPEPDLGDLLVRQHYTFRA